MLVKLQKAQFFEGRSWSKGTSSASSDSQPGRRAHVDELELSVLAKVSPEALLAERVKVLDVSDLRAAGSALAFAHGLKRAHVDVARSTRLDDHGDPGARRAGALAPADLEPAVVERDALVRCGLVEGECALRVDESHEALTGGRVSE